MIVFDEADRLLELGFREECLKILKYCARTRQTMLFSATLSSEVSDMAALTLKKPVKIAVDAPNKVVSTLDQEFVQVPNDEHREATLMALCEKTYTKRTIIFFQTKRVAHRAAVLFRLACWKYAELHGNLSQEQRVGGLEKFQHGKVDFLIATELAARGLDLPQVDSVVNFEVPLEISRYVHRVGRTARFGNHGRAVTLFLPSEAKTVKKIAKHVAAEKGGGKLVERKMAEESLKL